MKSIKKITILSLLVALSTCIGSTVHAQDYAKQANPLEFYNDALLQLNNKARQLDRPNMIKKDLDAIVTLYNNHWRSHQEDKAHCLYYIGEHLSKPANKDLAQPMEAFQNYKDALHTIRPSDSNTRGRILYRMGECYAYESRDIETAIRYYVNSITLRPIAAATLGDFFLFGWGVQQDLFLAATYYDLSQRSGAPNAYESNYCVFHTLKAKRSEYADSMSVILFERYVYNLMINNNNATAQSALMAAAQMSYAPAEYEIGERMSAKIFELPGMEADEWYKSAAKHGYAPALAGVASLFAERATENANGAKLYLKSMQTAERNGSSDTKLAMGMLYYKGNKFGFPKKDLKKAYEYIYTAYRISGTAEAQEKLNQLKSEYTPTAEAMKEIQRWSDSAYNYYNSHCDTLFEMINRHPIYGVPRLNINNTYFVQHPEKLSDINPNNLDQSHAQHYQTAYNLYADQLKRMSLSDDSYEAFVTGDGAYLQHRMKLLRKRAEKMPVNLIKKSLWEEWDGR